MGRPLDRDQSVPQHTLLILRNATARRGPSLPQLVEVFRMDRTQGKVAVILGVELTSDGADRAR